MHDFVIARRPLADAAILLPARDCFASLAMTFVAEFVNGP